MRRRHLLKLLLLLLLPFWVPAAGAGATPAAEPRDRVVFHINRGHPDYQTVVLRNLSNHISGAGATNVDVKVLLHGAGVALLLLPEARARVRDMRHANANRTFRDQIDALRHQGAQFLVSANTLQRHGIDRERDLYRVAAEDLVDNAISHLTRLQQQGYTYIKP
jgi:intracellular sulfur oxidation DsrE/DsrF family protein